ncbi:AAA family ATPase [Pseudoflavitalea sp. X16]|uniref:ATP-binding protein n=1 Tax=Paraflavitalea devenefica TaxID=2716334 RepID=UPI00141E3A71|nr:ATP-binding protein [Paraflavitalea devenefica]NII23553.1 AAA family ATPase [Paraflavitalea devenefica]
MSQFDYIKNIAKFGLENDQEKLLSVLNEFIEYSKQHKKINLALQLQSLLKESIHQGKTSNLTKAGSEAYYNRIDERELNDLILEKLTSDYTFENLVVTEEVRNELALFIREHKAADLLRSYELPVANKILLYGPSGCGKTLASYVIAGELQKVMAVVNLGAIVSAKLGETSKNLAKIFRKAAADNCIIFIDEFDSLGKIRDYSQDHGEMKRVVNTILQLFDFLPQSSVVIAATNQKDMVDEALLRRFDMNITLELPGKTEIANLIDLTLKNGRFRFPKTASRSKLINHSLGLSYFSIQKTLIAAIKRSLFQTTTSKRVGSVLIDTNIWTELLTAEKKALGVK